MRLAAHSGKHVLIIPGLILAYLLRGVHNKSFAFSTVAGFVPAVCVAPANCVINEWLDRDLDKFHPIKSRRSAVQKTLKQEYVLVDRAAPRVGFHLGLVRDNLRAGRQVRPRWFGKLFCVASASVSAEMGRGEKWQKWPL